MKKEEFDKKIDELLSSLKEDFEKQCKDGIKEKMKESLKIKDEYNISLETISAGQGVKCCTEIKKLSYGGAVALLACLDHIKDMIFEKVPEVKKFYGTPSYVLSTKMAEKVGSLISDELLKDCDGDCDDDE